MNDNQKICLNVLEYIEPIPENNWIMGELFDNCKACFYGHLLRKVELFEQFEKIHNLFRPDLESYLNIWMSINDNRNGNYQQETPKARITAALNDFIKILEA